MEKRNLELFEDAVGYWFSPNDDLSVVRYKFQPPEEPKNSTVLPEKFQIYRASALSVLIDRAIPELRDLNWQWDNIIDPDGS